MGCLWACGPGGEDKTTTLADLANCLLGWGKVPILQEHEQRLGDVQGPDKALHVRQLPASLPHPIS